MNCIYFFKDLFQGRLNVENIISVSESLNKGRSLSRVETTPPLNPVIISRRIVSIQVGKRFMHD